MGTGCQQELENSSSRRLRIYSALLGEQGWLQSLGVGWRRCRFKPCRWLCWRPRRRQGAGAAGWGGQGPLEPPLSPWLPSHPDPNISRGVKEWGALFTACGHLSPPTASWEGQDDLSSQLSARTLAAACLKCCRPHHLQLSPPEPLYRWPSPSRYVIQQLFTNSSHKGRHGLCPLDRYWHRGSERPRLGK